MKKFGKFIVAGTFATTAYFSWEHVFPPTPTTLSLKIGATYAEVVRKSDFPVAENSLAPTDQLGAGGTWVTKPAVILQFDDPKHGFVLPPTKFLVVTYIHGKVMTVSTSPMLDKLTFDEAFDTLAELQGQFQRAGWQPETASRSTWYDLTPSGRDQLHRDVLNVKRGGAVGQELVVPGLYSMIFRINCAKNCSGEMGPDRYLIDIGLGADL